MRKSNDDIPADEMLLAEAIAAAKARGFKWLRWAMFGRDDEGLNRENGIPERANSCCAYGALVLAGRAPLLYPDRPPSLLRVGIGNDRNMEWDKSAGDDGESLGWAFRCFFTQDEP